MNARQINEIPTKQRKDSNPDPVKVKKAQRLRNKLRTTKATVWAVLIVGSTLISATILYLAGWAFTSVLQGTARAEQADSTAPPVILESDTSGTAISFDDDQLAPAKYSPMTITTADTLVIGGKKFQLLHEEYVSARELD